jgi:hypothetical protein
MNALPDIIMRHQVVSWGNVKIAKYANNRYEQRAE